MTQPSRLTSECHDMRYWIHETLTRILGSIFDENGAVIADGDEVSDAARAELSAMKDSFTGLQARLQRMEALLNAFPSERRAAKRPRTAVSADQAIANREEEAEKAVELKVLPSLSLQQSTDALTS